MEKRLSKITDISFFKKITRQRAFAAATALLILTNIPALTQETSRMIIRRQERPFYFSGFQFLGLEDFFRGVSYVGYYTDKDLSSDKHAAAQFAEAQYILAPTILDLNNTDRELILFDCSSEEVAFKKIREVRAKPLKKNNFGIILARKTK